MRAEGRDHVFDHRGRHAVGGERLCEPLADPREPLRAVACHALRMNVGARAEPVGPRGAAGGTHAHGERARQKPAVRAARRLAQAELRIEWLTGSDGVVPRGPRALDVVRMQRIPGLAPAHRVERFARVRAPSPVHPGEVPSAIATQTSCGTASASCRSAAASTTSSAGRASPAARVFVGDVRGGIFTRGWSPDSHQADTLAREGNSVQAQGADDGLTGGRLPARRPGSRSSAARPCCSMSRTCAISRRLAVRARA